MSSLPERLVLVGPMGAGKSTIGRLLARELGYDFVDTDRLIEERCGANIPWIFDVEGEAGFRARETAMLEEMAGRSRLVLATGGGAVLNPDNRPLMRQGAWVIYLKTSVDQQYARTRRDRNRPLLQKDNPRAILETLFRERDPVYDEVSDMTVLTDHRSPRSVVRELRDALGGAHEESGVGPLGPRKRADS
ncbi:shikimate kinase [Tamilnaduibacter salinus]|uniref:Shikimate kinase n=1 Tax=Tamilnaduibacter salinus TaxID=1484056 RepID=A0A2A2I114_9GAMM|nr:shikimate kinase AroK [Tamilnaduibacter salinus]PAV24964.1 shikimate kinase I [Tamilnaduibacter salinus]PVY70380.1 shikimate kinase [Tamilnaduibacter salinus]